VFLERRREACFVLLVGGGAWTWIFLLKQADVLAGMSAGSAWVAAVTGLFYPAALPGEHARQQFDDGSGARDDDESHFQYR
jgi:hypothetical protein